MNTFFQRAFILHSKLYRERSALVDFFTPEGRFRAVLRGARTKLGSVARPFVLLELNMYGKGELKTVNQLEAVVSPYCLQGNVLFSALYLNELLIRLLPLEDAYPILFDRYLYTLQTLSEEKDIEPLLRMFEWQLLNELGYGFSLDYCADGEVIDEQSFYLFHQELGLQKTHQVDKNTFSGRDLLAMSHAQWHDKNTLRAAKKLMRQAIATHLQGKPLMSRELFK